MFVVIVKLGEFEDFVDFVASILGMLWYSTVIQSKLLRKDSFKVWFENHIPFLAIAKQLILSQHNIRRISGIGGLIQLIKLMPIAYHYTAVLFNLANVYKVLTPVCAT